MHIYYVSQKHKRSAANHRNCRCSNQTMKESWQGYIFITSPDIEVDGSPLWLDNYQGQLLTMPHLVITIFIPAQSYKTDFTELQIISSKNDAEVYILKEISAISMVFLGEKCLVLILDYSRL